MGLPQSHYSEGSGYCITGAIRWAAQPGDTAEPQKTVNTTENKSDKVSQGRHLSLVLRNQTTSFISFGYSVVTMGRTEAKIQTPGRQTTHLEVKQFAAKGPFLPFASFHCVQTMEGLKVEVKEKSFRENNPNKGSYPTE